MKRETLLKYRSMLRAGESIGVEQQRALVAHCLNVLNQETGGPDIEKLRQELAEKENNLKLILVDVEQALNHGIEGPWGRVARGVYIVTAALKYLRSPKTKDFQSWKDYRVMVDEEFSAS